MYEVICIMRRTAVGIGIHEASAAGTYMHARFSNTLIGSKEVRRDERYSPRNPNPFRTVRQQRTGLGPFTGG